MNNKCNQKGCQDIPVFRFTWPGKDEDVVCLTHAKKLLAVAEIIGMHLQLIPIETPDLFYKETK